MFRAEGETQEAEKREAGAQGAEALLLPLLELLRTRRLAPCPCCCWDGDEGLDGSGGRNGESPPHRRIDVIEEISGWDGAVEVHDLCRVHGGAATNSHKGIETALSRKGDSCLEGDIRGLHRDLVEDCVLDSGALNRLEGGRHRLQLGLTGENQRRNLGSGSTEGQGRRLEAAGTQPCRLRPRILQVRGAGASKQGGALGSDTATKTRKGDLHIRIDQAGDKGGGSGAMTERNGTGWEIPGAGAFVGTEKRRKGGAMAEVLGSRPCSGP